MSIERKQQRLIERYNEFLSDAETRTTERINRALAASFNNLIKELRKEYPKVQGNDNLFPYQKKILLLAEMTKLLNLIKGESYQKALEQLMLVSNRKGTSLAIELMNAIESDFARAVATIPLEAVRFAAEEQTRYLARHGEDFANKASSIIEQGLIQGWGVRRVEKSLLEQLGITKMRAQVISRTASVSAGNAAMKQQYIKHGMDGWIWVATPDNRVCPFCTARNGYAYDFKAIRPPIHPRCRCFTTPYKKDWVEKGLIDKEWYRNARKNTMTELSKGDGKPNYGPSPFERSDGLTKAPTPIWKP